MRICLVGSGSFARVHAAWWRKQPGAELVAVAGRDPKKLSEDPAWRGLAVQPEDAIAHPGRPWDLVDIVTPPGLHAEQALAALNAGYHVLCEKPLATSSADAERMLAAARRVNRRLFVVCQYRFVPAYRVILDACARRRPCSVRIEYTMPPEAAGLIPGSWKTDARLSGGGIVWSSGVHLVDLLLWWLGPPDGAVSGATARELHGIPVESRYDARWTAGGCAVELISNCAPGLPHRTTVEVRGDHESGRVVDWRIQRAQSPLAWKVKELALGVAEKFRPHRRDPLGRQFAEVLEALRKSRPSQVDADHGYEAVALVESIARLSAS